MADNESSESGTVVEFEGDLTALPPGVFAALFGKPLDAEASAAVALGEQLRRKAADDWAAEAEQRRSGPFRAAADDALRGVGVDPEPVPLAIVPFNRLQLGPLSIERRNAFEARFDSVLADARAAGEVPVDASSDAGGDDAAAPPPWAEQKMCGTCGGQCCAAGGEHAFIDAATLRRVIRTNPALTDGELRERYLARLPGTSYDGSCLYHAENGCGLDRTLRSDVCNETLCAGLKHFRQTPGASDARRVYVIAARGDEIVRSAMIDAD